VLTVKAHRFPTENRCVISIFTNNNEKNNHLAGTVFNEVPYLVTRDGHVFKKDEKAVNVAVQAIFNR
jgi:hypothetical protein